MSKKLILFPLLFTLAAPAISEPANAPILNTKQQAQFDRFMKDRVAGEPRSCIPARTAGEMTTISDDILVFGSSPRSATIYVNKPYGGCNGADRGALVIRRASPQLCRGDIAVVEDLQINVTTGSCAMGDFIPYTKRPG